MTDASFTVRLVNQVMAPARDIKKAMGGVTDAFQATRKALDAPTPKRGILSDWDKMMAKAKMSQRADFAKSHASAMKPLQAAPQGGIAGMIASVATGEALVGAAEAIGSAVLQAIGYVAELGYKFVEMSLDAAKFAERSTMAIGFLTNNTQQAGNAFDEIRGMAQGLGLDVNETVGSFQRLLAMQFSVGKSKDLIKMGADMQAIGADAEHVQRILFAISEIKSMGTLQKRQERMLQMAGISGQLIDEALMKKGGFKDRAALDKARRGNKIDSGTAIDAIMEAVMHKTHESKLGEAGKAFAVNTLQGMQQQLSAGVANFFIDIGQKILPGVTTIAKLVAGTLGKIADDPEVASLGRFLLNRFEIFTMWAQDNWPDIESSLIDGLHDVSTGIREVVNLFDTSTTGGKVMEVALLSLAGVIGIVALALGVAAVAGFVLMLPLYLLIGIVGLLVAGVVELVEYLGHAIGKIGELKSLLPGQSAAPLSQLMPTSALPAPTPANDTTIPGQTASGAVAALATVGGDGKTEGGNTTTGHTIHIGEIPIAINGDVGDPQSFAQKVGPAVRAELEKVLKQVS